MGHMVNLIFGILTLILKVALKISKRIVTFYYHYGHILELLSDLMGQKKIFAVVRVLNGVGLIVRALHKDAF